MDKAELEKAEESYTGLLAQVTKWTLDAVRAVAGRELSDDEKTAAENLAVFHPNIAMAADAQTLAARENGVKEFQEKVDAFNKKVADFCGIGVPEEEKARKRSKRCEPAGQWIRRSLRRQRKAIRGFLRR